MRVRQNILLGVSGGVAAYKAADLARRLMEQGLSVTVMMTAGAERFITPLTFEALTGNRVIRGQAPDPGEEPMAHITLPRKADLLLVAPATANVIGKYANGIADDSLTTTLLAAGCPVMMAPAMNTGMYRQPAVARNIETLKERGVIFIGPDEGELACGDTGAGKLAPVEEIVAAALTTLGARRDLAGYTFLVTAGGVREPIDAVRYIGNRSSGKMGVAIAEEAARRGATVLFVGARMEVDQPEGMAAYKKVETTGQMLDSVEEWFGRCDALVMAAAVGDYRIDNPPEGKVKKMERWDLSLVQNPDIIATMAARKGKRIVAGFAAETDQPTEYGRRKMIEKNLDLMVVNDVSRHDIGFGADDNEVTILNRRSGAIAIGKRSKEEIAAAIIDQVAKALKERKNSSGLAEGA